MILYLLTLFLCLIADSIPSKYSALKRLILIWLYIFLCFGYMTGSDWRNYELIYTDNTDNELLSSSYEKGFYYLIFFARQLISDFWIFLALVKILYLFAVIKFIKLFTHRIFMALALMININLLFMLVDNPLRFMIGFTILLFATRFLLQRKMWHFSFFGILAIFFHISLIIPVLICGTVFYQDKLINKSNKTLIIIYCICGAVAFFPNLLNTVSEIIAENQASIANKLLYAYAVDGIESLYTIGSILNIFLFLVVLKYKNEIKTLKYGDTILYFTLAYFFLFRILIIFPTGFRFYLFFSLFYCIAFAAILYNTKYLILKKVFIISLGLMLFRDVYTSYQYMPYTTSIIPILSNNHLPYEYRAKYNKIKYTERTGEVIEEYVFSTD